MQLKREKHMQYLMQEIPGYYPDEEVCKNGKFTWALAIRVKEARLMALAWQMS